jgi:hypothetical protein
MARKLPSSPETISLLTRLVQLHSIHLQQRTVHLAVNRHAFSDTPNLNSSSLVSSDTPLDLLIRLQKLLFGASIATHVVSFVGLNQAAHDPNWWRDELVSKAEKIGELKRANEKLAAENAAEVNASLEKSNAILVKTNASLEITISTQANAIAALSASFDRLRLGSKPPMPQAAVTNLNISVNKKRKVVDSWTNGGSN